MSNATQHLLSGAASGLAASICLQPFDLLKTRLQQGDGRPSNTYALGRTSRIAADILGRSGPLGLWRGTTATILRNVPGVALYFTSLNYIRTWMAGFSYFTSPLSGGRVTQGSNLPKLSNQGNLLAGAVSRVSVGMLLNPFTVLKARYESGLYPYSNLYQAFSHLSRAGPSEYLRGALPSALRDAPYAGLFVVFYERIKHDMVRVVQPDSATMYSAVHSSSGALAGAVAVILTHPFDVVKTKMQVRNEKYYSGFLATVSTIWKQRGSRGFYDGTLLRMSRKALGSAIGWTVYEGILTLAQNTS